MPALSWVRLARRLTGLVRQPELPHLEALIDAESGRQENYLILACAIPAGVVTVGGLSVFFAWVNGNRGLPLIVGATATVIVALTCFLIFFRLYRSVPPARQQLHKHLMKFAPRYGGFGNIIGGEQVLSEEFGRVLEEATGIYLRHCADDDLDPKDSSHKAVQAISDAMVRLLEVANSKDRHAQNQTLVWARPMLEELRLLDASLQSQALMFQRTKNADPLIALRDARAEFEANAAAREELSDQNLTT